MCAHRCNRRRTDRRRRIILARLALLIMFALAFVAVGQADYEDAKREADTYCQNVAEGVWPDYEGTYAEHCPQP